MKNFIIKAIMLFLLLLWLIYCGLTAYMTGEFIREKWVMGWLFNKAHLIGLIFMFVSGCFTILTFFDKFLKTNLKHQ